MLKFCFGSVAESHSLETTMIPDHVGDSLRSTNRLHNVPGTLLTAESPVYVGQAIWCDIVIVRKTALIVTDQRKANQPSTDEDY